MNSRQRRKVLRERVARGEHQPRVVEAFQTAHFLHEHLVDAIIDDRRRGGYGCRIVVGPVSLDKMLVAERKPSARSIQLTEPMRETADRHRVRPLRPQQRKSVQKLLARNRVTP